MAKRNLSDANMWRPFPSDDQYLVSRTGRVWSLKTNRELKGTITKRGNRHFTVYHLHKGTKKMTHYPAQTLVMNVWGEPGGEGETNIRHLDGNRLNNRIENLKWYNPYLHNGFNWEGL